MIEPKLFAVFGNPINHSKSPIMHNNAFKNLGLKDTYIRYHLENKDSLKEKFLSLNLDGANITVPFKEDAYRCCDVLDEYAKRVKAVNTIVKKENKLYGYNTDANGFLKAISSFENAKEILFLGAGGTAKATSTILKENNYNVTILNRSQKRLESFKNNFECFTFENFKPKKFDLIINMTSAGLIEENLPAPKEILEKIIPISNGCMDVIYGKETPFLKLAKEFNIPYKDGEEMLLYQGVYAFEHFTNYNFDFKEIKEAMQKGLSFYN